MRANPVRRCTLWHRPLICSLEPLKPKRNNVRILHLFTVVAFVTIGLVPVASAQSLGEVARQEEARRKTVKTAGKVYTNDSLRPEPQPSAAPTAASTGQADSAAGTPAPSQGGSAPAATDTGAAKDESSWRKRITDARDSLQRAQAFADALQSQINGLTTDFVNRDDPAQRAQIATSRDKATAELDRVKKEIAQHTKSIADIQEEGRRAGVPAGWLR